MNNTLMSGIITGAICFLITGDLYGSIAAGAVVMASSLILETG